MKPPPKDYKCSRPLLTHSPTRHGDATVCLGKMRLKDSFDNLPGMALVARVLVCDVCGRVALPEDAP